tara:strand:+ start:1646 stop:2509 length:864 start_codon:yes stop_codon:yes gene_type:complete
MEISISLKVNNEIITNFDIEQEAKYLGALNNELKKLSNDKIIIIAKNSLIREKIKKNEILKYFLFNKNQVLVNDFVKRFYTNLNFENEKMFIDYLNTYGLKFEDVKKKFEIELLWNELIKQKFSQDINIDKSLFKQKIIDNKLSEKSMVEYELAEILFKVEKISDKEKKIATIKNDININGFKNAANIYSISDTAKFGGTIGWINEGQLSKNILSYIEELNIGDVTEPIKTSGGYLILKIKDKKEKSIELDKEIILQNLINYEMQQQFSKLSIIYYSKIKLNNSISE